MPKVVPYNKLKKPTSNCKRAVAKEKGWIVSSKGPTLLPIVPRKGKVLLFNAKKPYYPKVFKETDTDKMAKSVRTRQEKSNDELYSFTIIDNTGQNREDLESIVVTKSARAAQAAVAQATILMEDEEESSAKKRVRGS